MAAPRRVLILGCGYVGLELTRQLALAGHQVFGARRTLAGEEEIRRVGGVPVLADVASPESLASLPGPFDWVVNLVSSSRGGPAEYRSVYLAGAQHVLDWLRRSPPIAYVQTSSTSVYGQTDGSWVDESSPASPSSETGKVLVATEQLVLNAARETGFPARILRVAGIYGPGRGRLFQQFLRGEPCGFGSPTRWLNMIHRDDVAGAARAVLERGVSGRVYNVADEEPVSQGRFLEWIARRLNRPAPSFDAVPVGPRKRGVTNKRVSSQRLRGETGWRPRYPTFREGYAAEIEAALAGQGGA